ncbi:MAG: PilZ domain-containing protein [Gammaproteobacteria bacterium]|nr:PilZ domain-containing protein [Gammaproteobacteria bacterium]
MGAVTQVEQRWSQRKIVSIEVDVVDNGVKIARSKTRDVGLGGVFLELDEIAHAPEQGQALELEFLITRSEDETIRHRLSAKVVRVEMDGIGLVFTEFDTSTFRALQEIMRFTPTSNVV